MVKADNFNNIKIICHTNIIEFPSKLFDDVYVFNESNKMIPTVSFYNQPLVKTYIPQKIIGKFMIDKLFLAYSNKFASLYNQNFYTEFYPYIYYYKINHPTALMGIPEFMKSDKLMEIIDKFLIDKTNIIWLQNDVQYEIKTLISYQYTSTFTGKLYLNELAWCIQALIYLNRMFTPKDKRLSSTDQRILYLLEDNNIKNNEDGEINDTNRHIINCDVLQNYFRFNDISIESVYDKKNLLVKSKTLSNNINFMTMYNDNVIELVFAKDIRNLVILNNKNTVFLNETFKFIFERIYKHKINLVIISDNSADKSFYQPFNVNIKELHEKILFINPSLRYNEYFEDLGDINKYTTDEDFLINYLFNILLKRLPNNKEFTYHLDKIKRVGRLEVYNNFLNCNEYKNNSYNKAK